MNRQRDERRHRAVARQHDMNVRYHTLRPQKRNGYMPAPVEEFLRVGESFCPCDHTDEQGCESKWLSLADTIKGN